MNQHLVVKSKQIKFEEDVSELINYELKFSLLGYSSIYEDD